MAWRVLAGRFDLAVAERFLRLAVRPISLPAAGVAQLFVETMAVGKGVAEISVPECGWDRYLEVQDYLPH